MLDRIQTAFTREFQRYGTLKGSDIGPMDYETKQACQELENISRIRPMVKSMNYHISLS